MKIYISILCLISLTITPSNSCEMTPAEQMVPATNLIERTKTIVLARVTSAEIAADSYRVIYTFQTVNTLKGEPQKTFTITGHPMDSEGDLTTFKNHNDQAFWRDNGGRSWNGTDCAIHPTFSVGATFLVFLDEPYHRKSFELIIRTHGNKDVRDKWLSWVGSQTKAEPAAPANASEPRR